ncbi:hypothetical protein ABIA14_002754 [Sinorhizobium fredii]
MALQFAELLRCLLLAYSRQHPEIIAVLSAREAAE